MEYKIIACDLDGTLLDENQEVSKENMAALEALTQMGVHIVPASGRAFEEMPTALLECPLIRYYITSDGAAVYDKQTGSVHELALSQEVNKEILDLLTQYETLMMIHAGTKSYMEKKTHNPTDYTRFYMNQYWIDFALGKDVPIDGLVEFSYNLPTIQSFIPFFLHKKDLEEVWSILEKDPRFALAQTHPHNMEIFSCKAGKGNALLLLADLLGIDPKATIAMGDSTNDISMLQAAGLGLAMENADPKAKQAADGVICHYKDHSLKYILEHYYV